MSSDSLAALRRNVGPELAGLAEQHLKHDLQQSDRDALKAASSSLSTHALTGSLIGISLGAWAAFRLRRTRTQMFNTFRTAQKPTHLKFADGRETPIPDMTAMLKPSALGDVATYLFLGSGGLFLGGEIGLLSGSWSAKRMIEADGERKGRIERAFKGFRVDVLKKEIADLESGEQSGSVISRGLF